MPSLLLVLCACGAVLKPPEPDRRLAVRTEGSMFESSNGYRFAVLPEPTANVVRLDVRYPVGSMDDPPGKAGLAHLVEHLLYDVEITRGGAKTSINAELGRLALAWNAETTADYTDYKVIAAPGAVEELLGLEVDRLAVGCAGLTPAIVAREREVVLEELRERQGASGAAIERAIREAVYPPGHPYRAVDSVESVSRLGMKDVCDFLAGPYRRGKAYVIASGAIDQPTLEAAASRQFGRLHPRHPATRAIPPPASPKPGVVRIKADVDEPVLYATWPLPARSTRDFRLLRLAWPSIPYSWDEHASMYKWGHDAEIHVEGGEYAPVLAASITLDSTSKLDDAIDAAKKSVQDAVRLLGHEKDDAIWQHRWEDRAEALLSRWESLGGRNTMFADFLEFDHDPTMLVDSVQELATANPDQPGALVEKWLAPSQTRYILLEPSGTSSVGGKHHYAGGAEEHGVSVDGALADRPLAVPRASARLETVRYKLDNGLSIILWPHGRAPLVHGRLVVGSGFAQDPPGDEGIAELVGATDVHADSMVFDDRQLAIRVDDLVKDLGWELRLPGYGLSDEEKDYLRARLRERRTEERSAYERDLAVAVYGQGHPYARGAMTEQSVKRLHQDLVESWARHHIVPSSATLVITGKFDPNLVEKHIAYNVDQVKAGSPPAPLPDPDPDIAGRGPQWVAGTTAKPSPTVELDVAFRAGEGIDRDYGKRLVLREVLSSMLEQLRGKQAVTYGFTVSYAPRKAGGLWRITGEVDATRAAEAATALVTLLREVRRDPESCRGDFVLARQKVLETLLASSGDSGAIADELANMARFDLPDDYFDLLARYVARLTLASFHPFVATELDDDALVFGAFGNAGPVQAALAAAKAAQVAPAPAPAAPPR